MAKRGNMNKNSYILELSESQLKLVNKAIEGYFRLHMGQFFDYVTEIAEVNLALDRCDPEYNRKIDSLLSRRDSAIEMFKLAYAEAHPSIQTKTPEIQRLIDLWAQIRYKLWKDMPDEQKGTGVDSYPPILFSGDLPIHIRKESDSE